LKTLKAKELKLRKELCVDIFDGRVGVEKKKFTEDGFNINAENKVTYKLDPDSTTMMFSEFTDGDREAIKWKPELKMKEYKKISEGSLLHECITIKPATPTLKVTPVTPSAIIPIT